MTDLVERLRERITRLGDSPMAMLHFVDGSVPLIKEAATALEAKDKELAALRVERDQMAEVLASPLADKVLEYAARAETAERERDEARAAFDAFAQSLDGPHSMPVQQNDKCWAAWKRLCDAMTPARAITGED